jgi:DNA-binding NarL/FixJ family response regulator
MTSLMHKSPPKPLNNRSVSEIASALNTNSSNTQNLPVWDIEKENRLSKVISLYSKGLSQEEIAQELGVDQSTVSTGLSTVY